jgi:uncharacterized membrane protein YkoI
MTAFVATTLFACSPTTTSQGHTEQMALLKGAKIELTDAIKAAQEKVPGRVMDTELRAKNGRTVWEVDIVSADAKAVEVDVDASTGQVVDTE